MPSPSTNPRPTPAVESFASEYEDHVAGLVELALFPLNMSGVLFADLLIHRPAAIISAGMPPEAFCARCAAMRWLGVQNLASARNMTTDTPHHSHFRIP
jgi:predicted oxidoreductase